MSPSYLVFWVFLGKWGLNMGENVSSLILNWINYLMWYLNHVGDFVTWWISLWNWVIYVWWSLTKMSHEGLWERGRVSEIRRNTERDKYKEYGREWGNERRHGDDRGWHNRGNTWTNKADVSTFYFSKFPMTFSEVDMWKVFQKYGKV